MPDLDLSAVPNLFPARVRPAERAMPALPSGVEPYTWAMEISSDRLDAYCTRMDPATTLRNYAREAEGGVAFLAGHNSRVLPFGYTFGGRWEQTAEGGAQARVTADAYTVPGLEIGGVNTDSFIAGMQAQLVRDVSIGFYGGQWLCSICGRDMMTDYKCYHWPGYSYDISQAADPGQAGSTEKVLCTALVVDAHLSEVSAVYDGATPGAMIQRATAAAADGRLNDKQRALLQTRYRIHLPDRRLVLPGGIKETDMQLDMETDRDAGLVAVRDAVPLERTLNTILEAAGRKDGTIEERVQGLVDQVRDLTPLAEAGRQYRADLVDAGVAEAVRAFGAEKGAAKRTLLERSDLDTIKELTASWKDIGDRALPGGRLTVPESGAGSGEAFVWKKIDPASIG